MDIKNCPRCGKMFTVIAGKVVCPVCEKAEEDDFKKVKDYISEHGEASLDMVVKETGVSLKRITKFIREGRLEVSKGISSDFRCDSCNAPIATGRFCEKCFASMKSGLTEALRPPEASRAGKMHSAGRRNL
jgi:flagellar operon protein (TIGR03826 family)